MIPGAVGGDLIKAAYLVRMHIKKTQAIASMVIDRILGLLGLFILAAVAGGLAWGMAPTDVRTLIMAAWVAVGTGCAGPGRDLRPGFHPAVPSAEDGGTPGCSLIIAELREMSTTYRGRLDVVVGAAGDLGLSTTRSTSWRSTSSAGCSFPT